MKETQTLPVEATTLMSAKRVLFIGAPFHTYHTQISTAFESLGFVVDYYDDRPSRNPLIKGIIKVRRSLAAPLIAKYFDELLSETQGKTYALVLIINCKVFDPTMIHRLRESQESARFVLYMWDSLRLYPSSERLIPIFDVAYSFDPEDCGRVAGLRHLPLFYGEQFAELGMSPGSNREYDIVSVCTAHPNRYDVMHKLFPTLEARGVRIFSYMYLHRLQYLYNRLFEPAFKSAKSSEFRFKALSEHEYLDTLKRCDTVFDIQHSGQSGLTMRTVEALGARRKLITTNARVRDYDFFDESNILVLHDQNADQIKEFLGREYKPPRDEIYDRYSLPSWINAIVN
jgi:hypothetical protein